MGTDTEIILIPCIMTEILTKARYSGMAVSICMLGDYPRMTEWHHLDS